jgi:hypothetical protein
VTKSSFVVCNRLCKKRASWAVEEEEEEEEEEEGTTTKPLK